MLVLLLRIVGVVFLWVLLIGMGVHGTSSRRCCVTSSWEGVGRMSFLYPSPVPGAPRRSHQKTSQQNEVVTPPTAPDTDRPASPLQGPLAAQTSRLPPALAHVQGLDLWEHAGLPAGGIVGPGGTPPDTLVWASGTLSIPGSGKYAVEATSLCGGGDLAAMFSGLTKVCVLGRGGLGLGGGGGGVLDCKVVIWVDMWISPSLVPCLLGPCSILVPCTLLVPWQCSTHHTGGSGGSCG